MASATSHFLLVFLSQIAGATAALAKKGGYPLSNSPHEGEDTPPSNIHPKGRACPSLEPSHGERGRFPPPFPQTPIPLPKRSNPECLKRGSRSAAPPPPQGENRASPSFLTPLRFDRAGLDRDPAHVFDAGRIFVRPPCGGGRSPSRFSPCPPPPRCSARAQEQKQELLPAEAEPLRGKRR